ncbi:hypothetical protein RJ639_044523 [Escallonia herrerae]|uniref:DNA methyltransferase 2 n=1 Tax=Escallonia herrerae TaxID=1293975 RepID=A0AA88WA95_9ASTE|nr:hypothetical protein RJ639_044523 [Escallonia herrerae]
MEGLSKPGEEEPWRVLEFYSGIGGMRYSIMKAGVNATMVEAFDINDTANDVYQHNFGHRPFQGNIQTLSAADLDSYGAHVWLLSPPCEPYTRQGLQKDSNDARASSFLKILELMPQTSQPPVMLFVENVVGFETSDTHRRMAEILEKAHFVTQEFILSPLHFGVPYSRPRYFCLAKRKPLSFQNPLLNQQLIRAPGPLFGHNESMIVAGGNEPQGSLDESLQACEPVERFLEFKHPSNGVEPESSWLHINVPGALEISAIGSLEQYFVPLSLLERWGNAMDATVDASSLSNGLLRLPQQAIIVHSMDYMQRRAEDKIESLEGLRPRYFTPREVANLHSFPENFNFPRHISLRQRYTIITCSMLLIFVYSYTYPPTVKSLY